MGLSNRSKVNDEYIRYVGLRYKTKVLLRTIEKEVQDLPQLAK